MIKKIGYFVVILIVFLLNTSFNPTDQHDKDRYILTLMMNSLQGLHFKPPAIDDSFSHKLYTHYLKEMDYNKRFLTQEDIDQLRNFEFLLDDEIKRGTFNFFDLSVSLLDQRIKQIKDFYTEVLSKPFDFNVDETTELENDKSNYAKNLDELKEFWRKSLKYQTLIRLAESLDIQDKAKESKDTLIKIKTFEVLEKESRVKVLKLYNDWFKRISRYEMPERINLYLTCIANCFDPHTEYFPPREKEDFDISMSGTFQGIGATLQEKDGYIKVTAIVPGSASWKQGELKVGDNILKVAQGNNEPVEVLNMRLDSAVKLIRGKKGTEVRLTVKKADGRITVIPIVRDVVIIEETYAKSTIIEDKKSHTRLGYIKLPQFYADFSNPNGRHCSSDILKEINKLNEEKVNGIVLDLRYNGGGSLGDVVDMAGFFIKKGPIVQVSDRFGIPFVYDDKNAALNFDKPLVVLVNNFSASASEIFAAAIQDYKRGVIIGSTTFGKGTVQRFANLDDYASSEMKNNGSLGSIKVTIQKFFRINGDATQLKGVIPDITLPDAYTYTVIGEKEMDYPMEWNHITSSNYESWSPAYDFSYIKKKSKERISKSDEFKLINENAMRLKAIEDDKQSTLKLDSYRENQKKLREEAKKYDNFQKDFPDIDVYALKFDLKEMKSDSTKVARYDSWKKEIKKDPYIYESVKVLEDMK